MKLNTAWLLKYLDKSIDHRELIDAMTCAGLEVEVEIELKSALQPIRIGFIREKTPISTTPGLFATQIEVERGKTISILVGSEHEVQVGWGVPVALTGTTLPTGKKVSAGKFHGVESVGMICLDGEMGLIARDTGMYHTTDESLLGRSLTEVIDIPEYLLELKVLPNRPDCLGVLGISRELAAILGCGTKWPDVRELSAGTQSPIEVVIEEPDLCRRFTASVLRGVQVKQSPGWLKCVLLTAGMRPINNVVDITNFVMWESGQPMHAFDLNCLNGPKIIVRKLRSEESLELLSGKQITSRHGQPLCVCDAVRPQALAGIMGGRCSETTEQTQDVLLEVAYFDPVLIRNTVKTLRRIEGSGGTDASYRFERGVDPNQMLEWARQRACNLIAEMTGGYLASPTTDVYPKPIHPRRFQLDVNRVSRMIGTQIDPSTVREKLKKLGYVVDENLNVTVSTFRVDVNDPVVLMEDVARLIGYDHIPMGSGVASPTRGQDCKVSRLRNGIARHLVSVGWYETKNDPLESPSASKWLEAPSDAITLSNAASAEMSVLRRSLLSGLVVSAQRNIFRHAVSIRLFEIDRTFSQLPGKWTLGGIAGGIGRQGVWKGENRIDFFTLKGEIEDLLDSLRIRSVTFEPTNCVPYKPGETAAIIIGHSRIGHMGTLDPSVISIERQAYPLYAFEIDLEALEPLFEAPITYTPINKLPSVVRDLAIVVDLKVSYKVLRDILTSSAGPLLEQVQLVDEYRGKPVPSGHRSLAFRLIFRATDRTLTAEEVQTVMDRIVQSLSEQTGAVLRS